MDTPDIAAKNFSATRKTCLTCSSVFHKMKRDRANHWARRLYCGVVCRRTAQKAREMERIRARQREYRERMRRLEFVKQNFK